MYKKQFTALLLTAVLVIGALSGCGGAEQDMAPMPEPTANKYGLRENVEDGAILHCFAWSFQTIEESLEDIAMAGYSAIQTSPVNACYDGGSAGMDLFGDGKWFYHYQPTDWTIGNYQLGTREEFISLCEKAEDYGIKVIVDVAPNHTTTAIEAIEQGFIDAVGGMEAMYHTNGMKTITDYRDRAECTLQAVGGLYDVNTENPAFQDYFIAFLNDCIACGADGFRFDTAKHIGLEDDPQENDDLPNNFWTRITTEVDYAESLFMYGEVLQDGGERLADYIEVIGAATASNYGERLRTAFSADYLEATNLSNNSIGEAQPHIVTWVESHDNYTGQSDQDVVLDNTQVAMAYAFLAARSTGTPLFFARPYGADEDNMWGTFNKIGMVGDNLYKNDMVVTANRFRNAMVGLEERIFNPEDTTKVVCVQRGTKGLFLVNASEEAYTLELSVELENGEYTDHYGGELFTVENGMLKGTLQAKSVAALYKEGYIELAESPVVKVADETDGQIMGQSKEITLEAQNCKEAFYSVNDGEKIPFVNGRKVVLGKEADEAGRVRLTLTGVNEAGDSTCISYIFEKKEPIKAGTVIYFEKPDNWAEQVFAYVYDEASYSYTKQNRSWPGIAMEPGEDGLYTYTFEEEWIAPLVIFTDRTNQSNGALEPGAKVEADKVYTLE